MKYIINHDEFIKLYEQNLSDSKIAKVLNVPRKNVNIYRLSLGLKSKVYKTLTDEEKQKVSTCYESGMKAYEICKRFNISHTVVKNAKHKGRKVKENVFSDIDNEEVQYWLGWLASDGCITDYNRIYIGLQGSDIEVLENFKLFLKTPDLKITTGKYRNKFDYCTLSFRNTEIAQYLKDLGITERKSKTLETNFPITFAYLRGYIEGDGYIDSKRNRIQIGSSSEKHTYQIYDFLTENNIKSSVYKTDKDRKSTFYTIEINTNKDVLHLVCLLYFNACTYLTRKYNNAYQIRNNLMKIRQIQGTSMKNPEPSLDKE